jgi:hypothetical protein
MRSSRPSPWARLARVIVVGFLGTSTRDAGMAIEVARRAAATGARVEMVGVVPPDTGGDAQLLELAASNVGHATVIRTGATGLEPADVDLALRYLPDVRAVVLLAPDPALLAVAAAAAEWSGAGLVIVRGSGAPVPGVADSGRPASTAIELDPPDSDPDGTFAGFVAALAVRLEGGELPERALRATLRDLAADPVA